MSNEYQSNIAPYGGIGIPSGSLVFKGFIAVATDFPLLNVVSLGDTYSTTEAVTDNVPGHTDTGQSFNAGVTIFWNGTNWTDVSEGGNSGDVSSSSTTSVDNSLARFDGTTGKLIQNSSAILGDDGSLAVTELIIADEDGYLKAATGVVGFVSPIPQADVQNLTTDLAAKLPLAGGTMTGDLLLYSSTPTTSLSAAPKSYVDSLVSGVAPKTACAAATTANLGATYDNGSSGVGATLTNSGAQAAFATDGYTASLNDRILVWMQSSALENGIYTVTTVGSGATNWVLTRSTDFDSTLEVVSGSQVPVTSGTLYAGSIFLLSSSTSITIGTDPISFTLLNTRTVAGNGITLTGNVISANIDASNIVFSGLAMTTAQNITSGSAPTFTGTNFTAIPESGVTNLVSDLAGKQPLNANLTGLSSIAANGFVTRTATSTFANRIFQGATNKISITNGDGVAGDVLISIDSNYSGQTSITTLGTIATGGWQGGTISSTYGGTGVNNVGRTIQIGGNLTFSGSFTSTLTVTGNTSVTLPTSGTILSTANASGNYVSSLAGTSNQVTVSGSTGAVTLSLPQDIAAASSPTFASITLSGTSAHGVLLGQNSSAVTSLVLGAGQLLIGTTSSNPSAATLTAGTGISITSATGSITIAGNGNDSTVDQTTSPVTMTVNTVYNSNAGASPVIYTLPATAAVGQWVEIVGRATGGWLIAQASGQVIRFGSLTTATGTGGSLASSAQGQTVKLRCTAANTDWQVVYAVGNLQVTA